MTNTDESVRVDENELLLITLMRHKPSAEVQILEGGELLSATRAGQILAYIQAMQAEAWDVGCEMALMHTTPTNPYRSQS